VATVPRTVLVVVSVNVTVPVGPEVPGGLFVVLLVTAELAAKVAVSVSENPVVISVAVAARVGVVLIGTTVSAAVVGELVAWKVLSPAYVTLMVSVPPGSVW
jgi:hypothetical protein